MDSLFTLAFSIFFFTTEIENFVEFFFLRLLNFRSGCFQEFSLKTKFDIESDRTSLYIRNRYAENISMSLCR